MTMKLSASIHRFALFTSAILLAAAASVASAQLPFFPGAEGYGGTYLGSPPAGGWFSDATVYHVTNLSDSGAGSLRNAFVQDSSNKIIVFDVAGTIQLTSGNLDIKNLSNYYVAGQTAPGPVTVYGDTTQINASNNKVTSNVILRYLSFRRGNSASDEDAITIINGDTVTGSKNMILDHVSASWATDENLSVAGYNTNVTVQYSIIADALTSDHAFASLIRPKIDSSVTFHHNLYAHNASRQARFGTYLGKTLTADFRNNVVYNWRDRASYAGGSTDTAQEYANVNYVGNYLIAGPNTESNEDTAFVVDRNVDASVYQSGNYIDSDQTPNPGGVPNGSDTGWAMFAYATPRTDQTLYQMGSPFPMPAVATQSAGDAYNQLIDCVGNWWWDRDAIDSRVIDDVVTFDGPPAIGPSGPDATELAYVTGASQTSHPVGYDTDGDAMPDEWEEAHGLNPGSSTDWSLDFDSDGYVNLIEFINDQGAFAAPAPIVFNGATNNRYAQITNWKTDDSGITAGSNWQPSRFDEAQINNGTVVVDAVGQHAGVLKIGANAGDNAGLSITTGRLDVEEELVIGADGAATASLSLSGGVLSTPTLSKGAGGSFDFTGGVLHADVVGFDLENEGGTLAPGASIGETHIEGDLTLSSGTLEIEVASASLADMLLVDGQVTLGGDLIVELLGGFAPESGSWQIIAADSIIGQFDFITEGYSVRREGDDLFLLVGSVLAGDYNGNDVVDAADYCVWRDAFEASSNELLNDPTPGTVDESDYTYWKQHFGEVLTPGAGSLADSAAVPEPASLLLLLVGSLIFRLRCDGADHHV